METKEFNAEEVSELKKLKWTIQDVGGLQIYRFIAWASSDPEIEKLFQKMRKAIYEEADQPKALKIGEEIKTRIMVNTQERMEKIQR